MFALVFESAYFEFGEGELFSFEYVCVIFQQEVLDKLAAVTWFAFAYVLPCSNDGLVDLMFVSDVGVELVGVSFVG